MRILRAAGQNLIKGRARHTAAAAMVAVLMGLGATLTVRADDRLMAPAGSIHQVAVENRSSKGPNSGGTRLVYRVQSANEIMQSSTIPGTDEPVSDGEVAIALSPLTGLPALVWTRYESGDYEIYFSLYDGIRWSTPRAVTANNYNDRKPQIFWGASDCIHLMWVGPVGADGLPTVYEAVFEGSGKILVPGQRVILTPQGTVTQTDSAPAALVAGDPLFAFDASTKFQIRVSAYGGYDEPIPVAKRVDLVMPSGTSPIELIRILTVGNQVIVYAKCGVKLFYSIQQPIGWTPLRIVTVDSSLTADRAELLIRDMIQRTSMP